MEGTSPAFLEVSLGLTSVLSHAGVVYMDRGASAGSGLEIVNLGSQLVCRVENYPCVYAGLKGLAPRSVSHG